MLLIALIFVLFPAIGGQARRECGDGAKYCDSAGGSCSLVENDEWTYFAQCECYDGFDGLRCDKRIAPGDSGQRYHCEGPFHSACPQGQTLRMDYASYGTNFASSTCAFAKHTCTDDRSLAVLRQECDGRQFCSIENLEYAFPNNNCTGKKSLIYRYRCTTDSLPAACPEANSIRGNDRCFLFDDTTGKIDYREAYERCRRKGGFLASPITARDHQQFIDAGIMNEKRSRAWIGAISNNKAIPSWNDGSNLTFVPRDSQLEWANACLSYTTSAAIPNSFFWVSENCDQLRFGLCSFVPGTSPVQPTVPIPGKSKGSAAHCEETQWRGVIFPRTRACDTVIVDCPSPDLIEGTISRTCECGVEPNGDKTTRYVRWQQPNSNNCTHKWVREMRNAVSRGREAEIVSGETANHLKTTLSTQLYGGDITGSVDLTRSMLSLARGQYSSLDDRVVRQTRAQNFTQNLGDCGDSLLEGRALPVWEQLPSGARINQASDLMQSLEESAILLADYSYVEKQAIDYDHWAMEVEVRRTVQPQFGGGGGGAEGAFSAAAAPPAAGFAPTSPFAANADVMDDSGFVSRVAGRQPVNNNDAQEQRPSDPVSFSTIRKSPIISLPSTSTLSSSAGPLFSPADSPSAGPSFFSPSSSSGASFRVASSDAEAFAPPQPTSLRLGYFVFSSLGAILSNETTRVNSQVIGATVNDASRSVQLPDNEPVTLTFFHLHTAGVANPRCVFWDTYVGDWSTSGCQLLMTNLTTSVCQCNHLTSFAILMDITGELSQLENTALDVVTVVGCAISIVCLLLSFLVFSCFRSLRGLRSTIHANLCLTLLLAELVFVLGVSRTKNAVACSVTALLLHLLFLSAFCWMLLEGVQLYMMLVQVFEPSSTHIALLYLFAYGLPAVIVGVAAGVDWKNYGTENYCWIDTTTPTIWAFAGPVAAVVVINIFFLLIALRVVLSISSRDRSRADRLRGWLKGSATLLCLLGITWVFGFLTAVHGASVVFAWIFTLLNCTQGIFIFVLHVLMNEKARTAVSRWLRHGWCCFSNAESAANYNSKEYVTSRQRFLNMIRSTAADTGDNNDENSGAEKRKKRMRKEDTTSSTGPSTASTDTKDKGPLTPTSKTSAWLSQIPSQDDGNDYDLPPQPIIEKEEIKDQRLEIKDQTEMKDDDEDRPPPLPSSPPPPLTPPTSPRLQYLEVPPLPPPDYDDDFIVPPLSRSTRSLDLRETDNRTPVRRKKFPLGVSEQERGAAATPLHLEQDQEALSRL